MIDRSSNAVFLKAFVLQFCEPLPPTVYFAGFLVVQFSGFFGETCFGKLAGAAQDMGVMVAVVAALAWGMNGNVSRAAVTRYNLLGEIHGQPLPFFWRKFGGQGYLELAGNR